MFLHRHGLRISTVAFGSGPRTLVAHGGWTGSWELWSETFERLQPDWRCVSFDHRGCGETPADPGSITLDAMVDDLFAVMDARDVGTCVLAGESRGAQVALLAAARRPERFDGLVLVSPAVSTEPAPPAFLAAVRHDYAAAAAAFVDQCVPEPDSEHLRRWGRDILARAEPEAAVRLLELPYEPPDYTRIAVPALVLHGTLDAIVPVEEGERLAALLPDAEFHALDGLGHVPTMTAPDAVAEIIDSRFGAATQQA